MALAHPDCGKLCVPDIVLHLHQKVLWGKSVVTVMGNVRRLRVAVTPSLSPWSLSNCKVQTPCPRTQDRLQHYDQRLLSVLAILSVYLHLALAHYDSHFQYSVFTCFSTLERGR